MFKEFPIQALRSMGASVPPKFSVDVPFFADEPLNILFLKDVTKNIDENQQAKSRAS